MSELFFPESWLPSAKECTRFLSNRIDFFVIVRPTAHECDAELPCVYASRHLMHAQLYDHDAILTEFALSAGASMPTRRRWPSLIEDEVVR